MVNLEKSEEDQDTHRSFTDATTEVQNQHILCNILDKLKTHTYIKKANND